MSYIVLYIRLDGEKINASRICCKNQLCPEAATGWPSIISSSKSLGREIRHFTTTSISLRQRSRKVAASITDSGSQIGLHGQIAHELDQASSPQSQTAWAPNRHFRYSGFRVLFSRCKTKAKEKAANIASRLIIAMIARANKNWELPTNYSSLHMI